MVDVEEEVGRRRGLVEGGKEVEIRRILRIWEGARLD